MDNATNNNTVLQELRRYLQAKGLGFDLRQQRLRCFGRVLNLVAKAFLCEALDDLVSWTLKNDMWGTEQEGTSSETTREFWRKRGPFGRLRNVITHICWTPQRRQEFQDISKENQPFETAFLPISASITRWNGDYKVILRALQLRTSFEVFLIHHQHDKLMADQLSVDDWTQLQDIATILEPFQWITLELEGHRGNGALSRVWA
jgi:hypothetical protein